MSNKNVTLKNPSSDSLFPKTFTHLVYNTNNESLDNTLSNMNTNISNKIEFSEDAVLSPSISPLNDYYNKSSVDTLLDAKVDKNPTLTSSSLTINSKAGTKYVGAHFVVESWKSTDGTQWYRKYNDGWQECGVNNYYANSWLETEIILPLKFTSADTINVLVGTRQANSLTGTSSVSVQSYAFEALTVNSTKTSLKLYSDSGWKTWIYACGY